jgi:RNA ligase
LFIHEYLDITKLQAHIEAGLVEMRAHKTLPLVIYCYSRKTIQEDLWDDVTEKCRGLIVDNSLTPGKHGHIIARPWEKFFNIETMSREETWLTNLPSTRPQVSEKLDGSMGTYWAYNHDGVRHYGVATKGSFHSEQAEWATNWINKHDSDGSKELPDFGHGWPEDYTPMFEIIAQEVQTHPIHYDATMDNQLILTAIINNETGEELEHQNLHYWGTLNKIQVVDFFNKSVGTVINEDRKGFEGYVLSWPRAGQTPLKVKVKHASFLLLQKISHSATPKTILQYLIEGRAGDIQKWMETESPDLNQFVKGWFMRFSEAFGKIGTKVREIVIKAKMTCTTRKEIAAFLNKKENQLYSSAAFAMIDEKDWGKAIWKMIKDSIANEEDVYFMKDDETDEDKE